MSDKVSVEQIESSKVNQTCNLPSANEKNRRRSGIIIAVLLLCVTPLSWAAEKGSTDTIEKLMSVEAAVNVADKDGLTPLHWAAVNGRTERVKKLIAAGANVNQPDKWGQTPLYAAILGNCTEVVKLLIAAGSDVNTARYSDGETPLLGALSNRNTEIVKLLIAAGADVNKANKYGMTPLYAARGEEDEELLKQAGAKE